MNESIEGRQWHINGRMAEKCVAGCYLSAVVPKWHTQRQPNDSLSAALLETFALAHQLLDLMIL